MEEEKKFNQVVKDVARLCIQGFLNTPENNSSLTYQDLTGVEVDAQDTFFAILIFIKEVRHGVGVPIKPEELDREKLNKAIKERIETILKTIF